MVRCPRLAIGTAQPGADPTAIIWALMDALVHRGLRVQSFLSRAYFAPRDGATAITGLPPRHVDSWLMCRSLCRDIFLRGCRASDLALVEGTFAGPPPPAAAASHFETVCDWLDLARVAIVDVGQLAAGDFPARPARLDAVLLDRLPGASELAALRSLVEARWSVPVVGWLGPLETLRRQVERIAAGRQPELTLCRALGDELGRTVDFRQLLALATSRGLPAPAPCAASAVQGPLRVAVAYDDAFRGYFPDALDLLEGRGATICDFSPLRDDRLPPATDVVYIGCGHPERFAAVLSRNDCLMLALKSHLCSGRRIYAECGGLAYLCHEIEMPDGGCWPMVGALPCTARFDPTPGDPEPIEVRLTSDTWLGAAGQSWRGYLSPRWSLRGTGAADWSATAPDRPWDVVQRHQAIGSRVYLNFAAQSELVDRFFVPYQAAPARGEPRRLV